MNRTTALLVAALLAAFNPPDDAHGQFVKNTNQSRKLRSVLAGGSGNLIPPGVSVAVIAGGSDNRFITNQAVIGGGVYNSATGDCAVVAGGGTNAALGTNAVVGGGGNNSAGAEFSTVGGGGFNRADGSYSFVGGGWDNTVSSNALNAFVGGGYTNRADGPYSFVGGGTENAATYHYSSVVGGWGNRAEEWGAFVGGGDGNTAAGAYSAIGGGSNNIAGAIYATVPGGTRAQATNAGAFVWSGTDAVDTASSSDRSFTVRAPGGVRFITTAASNNLAFLGYTGGLGNGVGLPPSAVAWETISDSNSKTEFVPINPREILSKVAALPVSSWHYKHDLHRRYIGPMAQDFHAAFGLGSDDKTISTLDSDGVMYAAIQGLVEELKERDKAIEELKVKSAKVDRLESELRAIREQLSDLPPR